MTRTGAPIHSTATMIEALVQANTAGTPEDQRERYAESLHAALVGLVKLAKAEQLLAMKLDVTRSMGINKPQE